MAKWDELVTPQVIPNPVVYGPLHKLLFSFPHKSKSGVLQLAYTLDPSGELWKLLMPRPHLRSITSQALDVGPMHRAAGFRITALSRYQVNNWWGKDGVTKAYLKEILL